MSWLGNLIRFGDTATVTIADSATPTALTEQQVVARVLVCSGTLTETRDLALPMLPGGDWIVVNNCNFSLVLGSLGLPPGSTTHVATNGSTWYKVDQLRAYGCAVSTLSATAVTPTSGLFPLVADGTLLGMSVASDTLTIATTGRYRYRVSGSLISDVGGTITLRVHRNGTSHLGVLHTLSTTDYHAISMGRPIFASPGDTFDLRYTGSASSFTGSLRLELDKIDDS
jgi:hypothetical protein